MNGGSDLDLPAGDYRIVPAVELSDISLGDALSGESAYETAEDGDQVHKHDVIGSDGTAVLEVFETHGWADISWLPFSIPKYVYVFVGPDGDPHLAVEVDQGWYPSYTIRDHRTEETLWTVAKSRRLIGDWQLTDPGGGTIATTTRTSTTKKRFSSATYVAWDVSGPDGANVAQFHRGPAEGSGSDRISAMNVSCSRSLVSPEQCLAFAFALLYEGMKSTTQAERGP